MSFEQELQGKVEALRKRDPRLSAVEAEAQVLNTPEMYAKYRRVQWTVPAVPETRPMPSSAAEAEAFRRADGLVSKSSGGLDLNDALAQVFKSDRELYRAYTRKQDDAAPSFGAELLGRQLDLYDFCAALQATIADILAGDAADKGAQITTALDDFRGAVLTQVREAGLEVTEKRAAPHPLAGDLLALATALNPEDPTGRGLVRCRYALAELTKTVQAKKRSAA